MRSSSIVEASGQSLGNAGQGPLDVVDAALADGLARAAAASQWAVVAQLGQELEQRRLARERAARAAATATTDDVIDLGAVRQRRPR